MSHFETFEQKSSADRPERPEQHDPNSKDVNQTSNADYKAARLATKNTAEYHLPQLEYTVQKGDTLWGIAEHHLSDSENRKPSGSAIDKESRRIAVINGAPKVLLPGMRLKLEH